MTHKDLDRSFRVLVEEYVRQIPRGRVMTYGQLAALAGSPFAARVVGGIAHYGNPDLPWQRVVNKQGGLASGYPGGRAGHRAALEAEGLIVDPEDRIDVSTLLWRPERTGKPTSTISWKTAPLLVIVGETASGKSALALELAEQYGGEIICGDSRTIYRGMDIGTAKPSAEVQRRVRHHCLDIVDPDETFTAADFKLCAARAIEDITSRGKLPILVGGTGLYIDAVLYDYQFRSPADPLLRDELNSLSVEELHARLQEQGIPLPENTRNPRHLIRALETGGQTAEKNALKTGAKIFGLQLEKELLASRIKARTEEMFAGGLADEVRGLAEKYGWEAPGLRTIGYQELWKYLEGNQSLQETQDVVTRNTIQYAKRQRTWFKRNNSIQWVTNREEITSIVDIDTTLLNK